MPKAGEFVPARLGALVFLTKAGCVIPLESTKALGNSQFVVDHPLSPSRMRFTQNELITTIVPGMASDATEEDARRVRKIMKKDFREKEQSDEINDSGIGFIPPKSNLFPKGIPQLLDITIDLHAQKESGSFHIAGDTAGFQEKYLKSRKNDVRADEYMFAADQHFGQIFYAFEKTFYNKNPPMSAHAFWECCEAYTEKGILIAGWTDDIKKQLLRFPQDEHAETKRELKTIQNTAARYAKTVELFRLNGLSR